MYDCAYCYNSTMRRLYHGRENFYRRRSVDNVIAEVRHAQQSQPVRFILFHDDIFTAGREWLEEFAKTFKRQCGIPFSCNVRIDHIDETTAALLRAAGCFSVSFGLEAGTDEMRTQVLKKDLRTHRIIEGVQRLKQQGIRVRTTNIIGATPRSLPQDMQTLRLNIACGVDYAKVGLLARYPNTALAPSPDDPGKRRAWGRYHAVKRSLLYHCLAAVSRNAAQRFERSILMADRVLEGERTPQEERCLRNLQRLFPLVVGMPFLFPLVRILVALPAGGVFSAATFLWDNYCSYVRVYRTGIRSFLDAFAASFRQRHMRRDKDQQKSRESTRKRKRLIKSEAGAARGGR